MAFIGRKRVTARRDLKPQQDNTDIIRRELKSIAALDREIEDANRKRDVALKIVKGLYEKGAQEHISDGVYEVLMVTPTGRSSTTIDAQKFYKLVGDKAFWSVVSVGVTDAKKLLGEKEMTKVATVKEGQPGEPVLTIQRVKKAK